VPEELSEEEKAKRVEKQNKINEFRQKRKAQETSGHSFNVKLCDIHNCIASKEFTDNTKLFSKTFIEEQRIQAGRDPLEGHEVTKEYRTKMLDWMIEVTFSFKCCIRTYFLAVTIFDKYLIASH
jgi:hypothetical protein